MKKKVSELYSKLKKDNSLRVKKSYYTFSREYPAGNIPIKRRKNKRIKSRFLKAFLLCVLFAVTVIFSFFTLSLGIEISNKEPSPVAAPDGSGESLLAAEGVRALYMPWEYLGDTNYIKGFIKEIQRKNCNSVVITFKTEEGKLNYSSMLDYAINGGCSVFDNDTVRKAVGLFQAKGISVIGSVYCFEDPLVAEKCPELAVKYMDTDVNWLDGSDENGGKPWLNPCLGRTHNYIIGVLQELYRLNIKGFILESLSFPDSPNVSTATYPGVWNFGTLNNALKSFLTKAQETLPDDAFVLMGYNGKTALHGDKNLYQDSMTDGAYDGYTVDLSVRDEGYTVDKKSKFSSMLSLFTLITANNPDKDFIPVIDMSEYSSKYISTIKKAGYTNYILYSKDGEY